MGNILRKFNTKIISKCKTIGVAVSGGADSMCLLDNLMKLSKHGGFEVVAINIDHNLRENSKNDSAFVNEYCKTNNIKLLFKSIDVKKYAVENKLSIESSARALRYEFFEKILSDGKVDVIALGHHKNDNVETALLNLFKGSALKGMCGIAERRDKFVRPLLDVTRGEIEEYVSENNIEFVTDESNFCSDYERNFLRNEVIPLVLSKFPNAINSIDSFTKLAKRDENYLNAEAEKITHRASSPYIYIENFKDDAISTRAILLCLKMLGIHKDVYNVNIEDVVKLAKSMENGSRVDIIDDVSAYRDYDKITFAKRIEVNNDIEIPIKFGEFQLSIGKLVIRFEEKFKKVCNPTYIDFDKLPNDAIIRTRRNGDVFLRVSGSKSLKDFLIDKKIPSRNRDELLVIASGNDVLAVLGIECGKDLRVDDDSKNIMSLSIDKINEDT